MASKADTRAAIAALAQSLNVETPDLEAIDKLEPLEQLLRELQETKAAEANPPPPDESGAPSPARRYQVASGRSVTATKRGEQLGALKTVRARDFARGQDELDELVAGGYVTSTDSARS